MIQFSFFFNCNLFHTFCGACFTLVCLSVCATNYVWGNLSPTKWNLGKFAGQFYSKHHHLCFSIELGSRLDNNLIGNLKNSFMHNQNKYNIFNLSPKKITFFFWSKAPSPRYHYMVVGIHQF